MLVAVSGCRYRQQKEWYRKIFIRLKILSLYLSKEAGYFLYLTFDILNSDLGIAKAQTGAKLC